MLIDVTKYISNVAKFKYFYLFTLTNLIINFHSFSTQQNQTLIFSLCFSLFLVCVKHGDDDGILVEGKVCGSNPIASSGDAPVVHQGGAIVGGGG
ncbi:hypothetical protein VIGAN_08237900 [Vigna angularis var. angularis]|uniref:Uncharacterized protein n=1 Tax=Vigna angularis var. angularis TaxID=157739 RepID=A0A0S3SS27_PHAAN|nr:hypothetical protein VIGAN_08237900 [Vigna angularis var. angularis]